MDIVAALAISEQIVDGLSAVAKLHPIHDLIWHNNTDVSVVLEVKIYLPKGTERGSVCVAIAEAFGAHCPIGGFPAFSLEEYPEILKERGEPEGLAPMNVALYLTTQGPKVKTDD